MKCIKFQFSSFTVCSKIKCNSDFQFTRSLQTLQIDIQLTIFMICTSDVIGSLITLEYAIAVLWIVYTKLV